MVEKRFMYGRVGYLLVAFVSCCLAVSNTSRNSTNNNAGNITHHHQQTLINLTTTQTPPIQTNIKTSENKATIIQTTTTTTSRTTRTTSVPASSETTKSIGNICQLRYGTVKEFQERENKDASFCKQVQGRLPVCKKNLTVGYMPQTPYVYLHNANLHGILPGILRMILQSCCHGCHGIQFNKINHLHDETSLENALSEYDLILPVKNRQVASTYNFHPYAEILKIRDVKVYHRKHVRADYLIEILIQGTYETWPLFVLALVMAFSVGAIVWLLDTWNNKEQFPRRFPAGVMEGFWWAYISMTTVGYGDLTPKSIPARIVAVVWILVGIVIFNMYTAMLTSIITANLMSPSLDSILSKKPTVGHFNNSAMNAAMADGIGWATKEFENVASMIEAFSEEEIGMFALEEHSSYYYQNILSDIYQVTSVNSLDLFEPGGLGIISSDVTILQTLRSFIEANEDLIKKMVVEIGNKHKKFHKIFIHSNLSSGMPFTGKSRIFLITAITTVIVAILCVILGSFMDRAQKKREKDRRMMLLSRKSKKEGKLSTM